VAGAGDQLHGAAPQGGDGQLAQVVEADQLLAVAVQDRQRLPEGAGDGDLVGEPARADAGEQAGPGRAVGPEDVGGELVKRQGRTGCGEAPGVGPGLGGPDRGGEAHVHGRVRQERRPHLGRGGDRRRAEHDVPGGFGHGRGGLKRDVPA